MKPNIEQVCNDLENGNLTDAKKGAENMTAFRISMYLRQMKSWSLARAWAGAKYLKGELSFQEYADTK